MNCRIPPKSTLNELAPISGYKIKLTASNSSSPKIVLVVPNPTEIVIDDLEPETEYGGQIAAVNLHGISEYSAISEPIQTLRGDEIAQNQLWRPHLTHSFDESAKPSRPISFLCTSVSSSSITFEWEIKQDEGSTACILQQSFGASDVWTTSAKCDASTTFVQLIYRYCSGTNSHRWRCRSTELRGLYSNQKYLFRLAAMNESGRSEFTGALVVRTTESTAAERKPKTKKLCWSTAKVFGELFCRMCRQF